MFELKYDGYRLFAEKADGRVTLYSRAGHDFTLTFPDVAEFVAPLPYDSFIIDGEVIINDARGIPSFALLQKRGRIMRRIEAERAALELPATLYAFDLLEFGGLDLRSLPLLARKDALQSLLPTVGPLRYSEHVAEQGEAMFVEAERMGLEGIVGKRAASAYVSKRSQDWVKVNAAKSDDFVVVGYLPAKNGAVGFSALLLAQYRDGELTYAGRVGGGFAQRDFKAIEPRLAELAFGRTACGRARREGRGVARARARRAGEVQAAHGRRRPAPARRSCDCATTNPLRNVPGPARPSPSPRKPSPRRVLRLPRPSQRSGRSTSRTSTRCSGPPRATRRAT